MKRNILILMLTFGICILFAQEKTGKILVKGKVKGDKIYLRWATDDMFVLEQGLKQGFVVHRQTILKNNAVQNFPLTVELSGSPFLPKPLEQWESLIDDDNFAIAAQALYGESFEVGYSSNPFMQAAQKEQDRNQRLGFLLFACDQNFATAEFSALGLVDAGVRTDEKYLYVIFIKDTSGQLPVDTGYCFIGLNDVPGEPVMDDVLRAKFSEHQVALRWDIRMLKNFYSSYLIERSENGRDFYAVNDRPFVLLENPNTNPNEMVFVDSLRQAGKTYSYRIRGKDAFGDLSSPSNVVQGKSQKSLEANPELLELKVEKAQLQVSWAIDPSVESEVSYFEIRSRTDRFGEDVVLSSRISAGKRHISIPKPSRTCYITAVAVGKDGTVKPSLPMLFQEEDNSPPDAPTGLRANVDTGGVVSLQWKSGKEDDLSGYRVFRANQATAEFIQVTTQEIKDTVFYDTVSMNTATGVFYKVMAVDFRGNQSKLSIVCEAKRPIMFAPSAPVIVNYRLDGQTLFLKWANSAEEHVTATEILISTDTDYKSAPINPTILGTIPKTSLYDSATFLLNQTGKINIVARSLASTVAGADLQSVSTKPLLSELSNSVSITVVPVPPSAPELYAKLNREQKTATLNWVIKAHEPIERLQILRSTDGGQLITLKDLPDNETQYIDAGLEEGKIYEYRIRVQTESGTASFSKKMRVNF